MKILNLEINNRIHYTLNFDKPQRKNVSFVIQRDDPTLFSFRKIEDGRVVIRTEKENIKLFVDCTTPLETTTDTPVLTFSLSGQSNNVKQKNQRKPLAIELNSPEWEKLKSLDKLKVVFKLNTGQGDPIERFIDFTFCEANLIYNVVLDFGSEASQMSISERGVDIGNDAICDIFSAVKNCYGKSVEDNTAYVQYCGKTKLYRSFYYIKKKISNSTPPDPWKIDTNDDALMSFLSKRSDLDRFTDEYISLPNAKIASFGGVAIPQIEVDGTPEAIKDFGDDYFYRHALDSFIYEALSIIKSKKGTKNKAANICILMPNVYSLPIINKKLSDLAEDIQAMLTLPEFKSIIGYELCYASESDASMLGLFAANLLQAYTEPAGNYLIMDAGKGTLDFSILEYNPGQQKRYKNRSRSGIVGAGNAITYAIMLAIVYEFIKRNCEDYKEATIDDDVKRVVFEKIYKADLAEQFDFFNAVEKYKVKYNENTFGENEAPDDDVPSTTIPEIKISGITSAINGLDYKIPDPHKYIEKEIQGIALDVYFKLKQITNRVSNKKDDHIQIDKVIFTGRGFLMKELQDSIINILKVLQPNHPIELAGIKEEGHEKDICLYIAGILSSGAYDVSLEGAPVLLGKPKSASQTTSDNKNKDNKKGGHSSLLEVLNALGQIIAPDIADPEMIIISGNAKELEDKGIKISSYADIVNIGGIPYELPNLPEGVLNKEVHFHYDGEEFLLEIGKKEYKFRNGNVNLQKWHDFQSMFPNVKIDRAEEIVIPKDLQTQWQENISEPKKVDAVPSAQSNDNETPAIESDEKPKESLIEEPESSLKENLKHILQRFKNKSNKK